MSDSSSEITETAANASAPANQDVNKSAGSSASGSGVETPSLIEAVSRTLDKKGTEASPASESGKDQVKPENTSGNVAEGEGDPTEDEIKSYAPNSQRRIRQLLGQRDDFKLQAERLQPRAEQNDRLVAYMRENEITAQELNNVLEITRVINAGDYSKALQLVAPIYQELASRAGEVIPKDLQERVRLGHISEQDARELNRNRAAAEAARQRETRQAERSAQAEEERRVQTMVGTATKAADDWAKEKAKSDPDWHLKQDQVVEQIRLMLFDVGRDGYPKTAQEAVALSEKALKKVEDRLKMLRPKPTEVRPVTGNSVSPHAKAEPKTLMEAVSSALRA